MPTERSAEEIVRENWSNAEIDGDEGHCAVFVGMYQMSDWKATEWEAWADAAARIKASETVPVPSSDAPADPRSAHAPRSTSGESR